MRSKKKKKEKKKTILFFTLHVQTIQICINICDKYNVEGCQKSLSHPSWPPVVTNRYDITNNGEDRTEKNRTQTIMLPQSILHAAYASATYNITTPTHITAEQQSKLPQR